MTSIGLARNEGKDHRHIPTAKVEVSPDPTLEVSPELAPEVGPEIVLEPIVEVALMVTYGVCTLGPLMSLHPVRG